jgi:hypothetical protein
LRETHPYGPQAESRLGVLPPLVVRQGTAFEKERAELRSALHHAAMG